MIDSKKIIYLPTWIKVSIVTTLALCLISAIYVSLSYIGIPEHSDWILLSLSLAQLAATALVISLVLIFGEREENIEYLKVKTNLFLTHQLPKVLEQIEDSTGEKVKSKTSKPNNIFGANYELSTTNTKIKMWVGINVDRIIISYFIKSNNNTAAIRDTFKYTFGGAETVGYKINYEEAKTIPHNEEILSIWCTWPAINDSSQLATELLSNPEKKLFIIQDIAMMTQSFLRTAERQNINAFTESDPGPL